MELTHHNANHLDLGSDQAEVFWTTRFYDPDIASKRTEILRRRHQRDDSFRKNSVEILRSSTRNRAWTEDRVLEAIRDFNRENARPPFYSEFRRRSELPDPSTVWRRFGSVEMAIVQALNPEEAK